MSESATNTLMQRARLLMSQERYQEARGELARALANEPNEPELQAWMAYCHTQLDEHKEAVATAKAAVHFGPDIAYCHFVLGYALLGAGRPDEARAAAHEAIRLDPEAAEHFGLLASILIRQQQWALALGAADQGLVRDPGDEVCLNMRGLALTMLGRKQEAAETVKGALQVNPDNALSHANTGWAALHRSDHRAALEHFREALRLDPTQEWAREGLVEALKARYWVYRIMLTYFLWMSRLSRKAQWAVILGGYFAYKALKGIAKANPGIAPYLQPLLILYGVFALMTWLANPMFEALLRLNRFGRYALLPKQIAAANALISLMAAALLTGIAGFVLDRGSLLILALVLAGMTIPLCTTLRYGNERGRGVLAGLTVFMGIAGLVAAGALVFGAPHISGPALAGFALGLVAFPWITNAVAMRNA